MAATRSIPEQTYQPGSYGPFPVDANQNTTQVTATFTRVNFPGTSDDVVAEVTVLWDDGAGVRIPIPGGVLLKKDGSVAPTSIVSVQVRKVSDGQGGVKKSSVVSAQATMEVFQAITTAITVAAT